MKSKSENIVKAHPHECPFVDRSFVPVPEEFNIAFHYPTDEGDYIFYDHNDGFGEISRVQFCELMGRKRDVFECFNESEWKVCSYYRHRTENESENSDE